MSFYGAGATKAGINTADQVYFQLRPTATSQRLKIFQIVVNIAVAPTTAPSFYLVRSSAIGTNSATLAGQPLDPNDPASIATWDSNFSAQPTFTAANKMATGALAVTAGGAFVWTFPSDAPIVLAASTTAGLCVANTNASGATTGTFVASCLWRE